MPGALLDTHALYWLITNAGELAEAALVAIADNQAAGTLFVSPITAWELAIASKKPAHKDPPNLGALTPGQWFSTAVTASTAKVIPIRQRIACEAAMVPDATGHKDTGDCYIVATARVRKIPVITRDDTLRGFDPDYLSVIVC